MSGDGLTGRVPKRHRALHGKSHGAQLFVMVTPLLPTKILGANHRGSILMSNLILVTSQSPDPRTL